MQKGDVIFRFDQYPWRDLRKEIEGAQEQTGGALIVTASLAAHVFAGGWRWRITVDEPTTDFARAALPFHGLEVATGCGLVIAGSGYSPVFFTTRPLLVMAGMPPWPATAVGQEIIRLRRAGEIPDIPPGHPEEDCQALHCARRVDREIRERGAPVPRTDAQVIADINGAQ